jgi:hypothetical protein
MNMELLHWCSLLFLIKIGMFLYVKVFELHKRCAQSELKKKVTSDWLKSDWVCKLAYLHLHLLQCSDVYALKGYLKLWCEKTGIFLYVASVLFSCLYTFLEFIFTSRWSFQKCKIWVLTVLVLVTFCAQISEHGHIHAVVKFNFLILCMCCLLQTDMLNLIIIWHLIFSY